MRVFDKILHSIMYVIVKSTKNRLKILSNLSQNERKYKELLTSAKLLLEDCKKFGTLPFAGLARCAFIAIEILNSFVEQKIITNDEKMKFLSNIKTITSQMQYDLRIGKKYFIKKYGHLRPGTYEITSKNYEENFDNYFGGNKKTFNRKPGKFNFSCFKFFIRYPF